MGLPVATTEAPPPLDRRICVVDSIYITAIEQCVVIAKPNCA